MLVNSKFDCEILLQVGETPPPGQPPLSRPTDQNANDSMWLSVAQLTSRRACACVKMRPLKLRPIIGVTPSMRLRWPSLFSGQISAIWRSVDSAAVTTASPQFVFDDPNSIVIGLTTSTRTP